MIPKQIFFIWFGDNKPDYVDFAVRNCKEVNSDYKVELIEYNRNEIENAFKSSDELLRKSYDKALRSKKYKEGRRSLTITMVDTYKKILIDKYGGFYSDSDMFFFKPIPSVINKFTRVRCTINYSDCVIFPEGGFEGCESGHGNDYSLLLYPFLCCCKEDSDTDIEYKKRKDLFLQCKLSTLEYDNVCKVSSQFCEHMGMCSWWHYNR